MATNKETPRNYQESNSRGKDQYKIPIINGTRINLEDLNKEERFNRMRKWMQIFSDQTRAD